MRTWGKLPALILGLAVTATAQVTLNFDDLVLADYDLVPSAYGSGLHSNLASIGYRTFDIATAATVTDYVEFWNVGYGDLSKVVFASSNGYGAEVSLVPAAGFGIVLVSFDMAGWPNTDRANNWMRLVNATGGLVFDFAAAGPVPIEGDSTGPLHSAYTPNLFVPGTVRLQWGPDWNVGLDNLRFNVVAIPEPATWILIALGGGGFAWSRRRSRRRTVG